MPVHAASLIQVNEAPPAGFEDMDAPETSFVDVYYGERLLAAFEATFTDTRIRFLNPEQIVAEIPLLNPQSVQAVTQALTGDLLAHPSAVCLPRQSRERCGLLRPEIAAVIFDRGHYRVTLFINAKHLVDKHEILRYLPPSSSNASFIHALNGIVSGSRDDARYTFYNREIFTYRENRLMMSSIYTNTQDSLNQRYSEFRIDELFGMRHKNGRYYQLGIVDTQGGNFLTQQTILGGTMGVSRYTMINADHLQGTPLEVFLPVAGMVDVFKGDRLLTHQIFMAGKHRVDTTIFPAGSYDVRVRVLDNAGGVIEESTVFYTKIAHLPPVGHPEHFYSLGLLPLTLGQAGHVLPRYGHTPFFEVVDRRSLAPSWGLESALATTLRRVYLTHALYYIHKSFLLEPAFLVSNNDDYGGSLHLQWAPNAHAHLDLTVRRIWAGGVFNPINDLSGRDFDPVTSDSSSIGGHFSYHWSDAGIGLTYWRNTRLDGSHRNRYAATYRRTLFRTRGLRGEFQLDITRSGQEGASAVANLSLYFRHADFYHHLALAYREHADASVSNPGSGATGYLSSSWKRQYEKLGRLSLQTTFSKPLHTTNADFNASLVNPEARLEAHYSYNKQRFNNTRNYYSAGVQTNFVITPTHFDMHYGDWEQSVLLLHVDGPKGERSRILVNNHPVGILESQKTEAVFLEPYRSYDITLAPEQLERTFHVDPGVQHVTLYQGNAKPLDFSLNERISLFAHFVNVRGEPVLNALVTGAVGLHRTDAKGWGEFDINKRTRKLSLKQNNGATCEAVLPKKALEKANGYLYLERVVCQ